MKDNVMQMIKTTLLFIVTCAFSLNAMEHQKEKDLYEMRGETDSGVKEVGPIEKFITGLCSFSRPSAFCSNKDKDDYLQTVRDGLLKVLETGHRNRIDIDVYIKVINHLNTEIDRAEKIKTLESK